jgi:hypothetical protein
MNAGKMIFTQVLERVPHWEFRRLEQAHDSADGRRQFSAWDHFLALAFAQMTFRESLRDIEACLSTQPAVAYHMGFRTRVTRSTLARANEEREWRLFAALAHKLIARARRLYADEPGVLDLDAPVYAVDSTLIDLSLALCPWANWTGTDAAVKLHTLLDLRGPLPAFVAVTPAEYGDVLWLDELPIEPGSFYVMDVDTSTFAVCVGSPRRAPSSSSGSDPTCATTSPRRGRSIARPSCAPINRFGSMVRTCRSTGRS